MWNKRSKTSSIPVWARDNIHCCFLQQNIPWPPRLCPSSSPPAVFITKLSLSKTERTWDWKNLHDVLVVGFCSCVFFFHSIRTKLANKVTEVEKKNKFLISSRRKIRGNLKATAITSSVCSGIILMVEGMITSRRSRSHARFYGKHLNSLELPSMCWWFSGKVVCFFFSFLQTINWLCTTSRAMHYALEWKMV